MQELRQQAATPLKVVLTLGPTIRRVLVVLRMVRLVRRTTQRPAMRRLRVQTRVLLLVVLARLTTMPELLTLVQAKRRLVPGAEALRTMTLTLTSTRLLMLLLERLVLQQAQQAT